MPVDALPPSDRPRPSSIRRFPPTLRSVVPLAPPVDDPETAICRRFAAPELSISGSRDLVGRCLAGWGVLPEAIDDARLVVSELVTNAVRHDHATRVDVEVVDLGDRVTVVVAFDGSAGEGHGRPLLPSASATSGRGLAVVDRIAQRWGRVTVEGGGRVWAVLAAPRVVSHGGRRVARAEITAPAAAARPVNTGELLVRLAEALGVARTPADVAAAVASVVFREVDALGVRFSVVERGRRHLLSLALAQQDGTEADGRRDLLDAALPSAVVARTGRALFLTSHAAMERAVPDLAAEAHADGIETIAALPLVSDGVTTGVLTVVWDHARELAPAERATLFAVASFAASALQRASMAEEHRATAEVLQATLLPQSLPDLPGIDIATVYRPLGHAPDVGGDWYDAFVLPSGKLFLVIGDVAGHGTTAARTMGKIRYSARAYAIAGGSPAEVLARTNALLRHHGRDLLASMICVEYDPAGRTAVVANAGHPPALAVPSHGPARFLEGATGPMLGAADSTYDATTHVIARGETVLLYTDGLFERRNVAIDDSLADLAIAAGEMRRFRASTDRLVTALADRRAASDVVTDDICLLAVAHG